METFSERLTNEMNLAGLSRRDLLDKINAGSSALAKWLNGSLVPKSEQLLELASALGVTMEWLLAGNGPRNLGEARKQFMKRAVRESVDQEDFESRLDEVAPLVDEINSLRQDLRKIGSDINGVLNASLNRSQRVPDSKVVNYDHQPRISAMISESVSGFTLPFLGSVAAGDPVNAEVSEEWDVAKEYPKNHFIVRVNGQSMAPLLQDGDLIVVDARDIFTPRNKAICVVSDGSGSSIKRWNRKAGLFESLNPDYPDLEATEEVVFQGYFVEKVD